MNYLDWQFQDNAIVQLTHQTTSDKNARWVHGWFDNADDLLKAGRILSGKGNLFISLNKPFDLDVSNKVDSNTGFKNENIERYTRLFIDLDPGRDGYIASNQIELDLALERQRYAEQFFRGLNWPRPARAISGNGAHLIFRTALPNTPEFNQMLSVIYKGLKTELSTDLVTLDSAVKNACRIHPLYGSIKRKGIETPDRPYRRTTIKCPQQWLQVTARQIERLAEHYTVKTPSPVHSTPTRINGKGDYKTLDVVSLFSAHGLYLRQAPDNGKHWVTCPWSAEHSATGHTDSVIWEVTNSFPTFHCSHDHCNHRKIMDVINLFGDADNYCSTEWVAA